MAETRKRKLPSISESAAYLDKRRKQAEKTLVNKRLGCLWLIASGLVDNQRQIAYRLEVQPQSVSLWLKRYETDGFEALLKVRKSGPQKGGTLGQMPEVLTYLQGRLNDAENAPGGYINLWREVQQKFDDQGFDMGYHAFYAALHAHFPGTKLKASRPRHFKQDPEAVEAYKKKDS